MTGATIDYIGTYFPSAQGFRHLDLDGTPGAGGVMQTFATIPGAHYEVTFDLAGNPGWAPATKRLLLEAAGQSAVFEHDATLNWSHETWKFTATSSETTLHFRSLSEIPDAKGGALLDNVCVGLSGTALPRSNCNTPPPACSSDTTATPVDSTFASGAEGWTIRGDAGPEPDFEPGAIRGVDRGEGITWYWLAPPRYLGNQLQFYGRDLVYRLRIDSSTNGFNESDVILGGGGLTLTLTAGTPPGLEWTEFRHNLSPSPRWTVVEEGNRPATEADFCRVLAALDTLAIRGEFRNGSDVGWLGGVTLGAAPLPIAITPIEIGDNEGRLLHRFSDGAPYRVRLPPHPPMHDSAAPHTMTFTVDATFDVVGVVSNNNEVVSIPDPLVPFASGVTVAGNVRQYQVGLVLRQAGEARLELVVARGGQRTTVQIDIAVGMVDLVVGEVPEQDEETIGGFVAVGDVVPVRLRLFDRSPGYATLSALEFTVETGGDHIQLWYDRERTRPVVTEARGAGSYRVWWEQPADVPGILFIEGISASAEHRDVRIHLGPLNWGLAGPDPIGTDTLEVTVVRLDLDLPGAGRPGTPAPPGQSAAVFLGQNDDNDNGDPTLKDYEVVAETDAEDDLRLLTFGITPYIPPDVARTVLSVSPGLALWEDGRKAGGQAFLGGLGSDHHEADIGVQAPPSLYAEGLVAGLDHGVTLRFEPRYTSDTASGLSLILPVHVVKTDIDVAGIPDEGDVEFAQGGVTVIPAGADDPGVAVLRLREPALPAQVGAVYLTIIQAEAYVELRPEAGGALEEITLPSDPDGATTFRLPLDGMPSGLAAVGLLGSPDRAVEIRLSYYADNNGTPVLVHFDRVALTVREQGALVLAPVFIPVLSDPELQVDVTPLSVFFVEGGGTRSASLEGDAGTAYRWIGQSEENPLLELAYEEILSRLRPFFPSIGLATLLVEQGTLTVSSRGINVIQAVRGEHRSNMAVVVAGLRVKDFVLAPGLGATGAADFAADLIPGVEDLDLGFVLLQPDSISDAFDKSGIRIRDVTFEFLAGGEDAPTIALSKLVDVTGGILSWVAGDKLADLARLGALPAWAASTAFREAVFLWIASRVSYETADERVASVTSISESVAAWLAEKTGAPIKAVRLVMNAADFIGLGLPEALAARFVQAGGPGAVALTGTLDLGSLGTATATLPVFVLPMVETVEIHSDLDGDGSPRAPILIGGEAPATARLHAVAQGLIIDSWQAKLKNDLARQLVAFLARTADREIGAGLAGEIEIISEDEESTTIAIRNLRMEWHVRNLVPSGGPVDVVTTRLAQGRWTIGGTELGEADDPCFGAGRMLEALIIRCADYAGGLLYDPRVTALPIREQATLPALVRLALPLFGCPDGALDATEVNRCTATRPISVMPGAAAIEPVGPQSCSVGQPINRTVIGSPGQPSPSGPSLADLDGRFEAAAYAPLLEEARDAFGLVGMERPEAAQPGTFGPIDRGTAGWQAGWLYFVEFPVTNPEDCRLVVAMSTASGTDLIPTTTQSRSFGRPQDTRQWRWQANARYRSPDGGFTDAIIFMNVVVLGPPRGAGFAVHRLEERVLVLGLSSATYLYRVGQTLQVVLRRSGENASVFADRVKVLGGDRPGVGPDQDWPVDVTRDLYATFRGLAFSYLPENR